jgi:PAS domain S-box-containing protein
MDIVLKGEMDGIEAAQQIRARFDIPVIFLTAHADPKTLQRAKVQEPFGYVLKPFQETELSINIEMALYKHKTERSLRESQERYRTIVEDMPALVCRFLPDGTLTYVNQQYCQYFRYRCEDLLGQNFFRFIPEEEREEVRAHYNSLTPDRPVITYEHQVLAPDGTRRWQRWTDRGLFDVQGEPLEYQSLGQDITERRQIEDALQRHNRNLALLNQVSQTLTATLDLSKILQRLLEAAVAIVGAEGSSVWLWSEEHGDQLVCRAILVGDQYHLPRDLRLRSGQGIVAWVAQSGQSALAADAQTDPRFFPGIDAQTGYHTRSLLAVPLRVREAVIGTLEMVNKQDGSFDADDLALVEMLAASAAAAIDNARLVAALRQYGVELEARNQDLDAFAHTAAHDLRNPLARVVGYAEVLEGDYAALKQDEVRGILHRIAQNGRTMNNIIDEMLLLAGVRQMENIETAAMDTAQIVAEAQQRLADLIEEHHTQIIAPDHWVAAVGYAPWVEEVWVNYLSNAITYGGRPPRVEIGATEQADGRVRFWVRDNGPGLTHEEQARLFKPFTRLDQVRAKGYGLGLSIVRRIVEKLGGQVGVESDVGTGSTFFFVLPGTEHQATDVRIDGSEPPGAMPSQPSSG